MDFYSAMLAEREQNTIRQERLANGKVRTVSGTGEAEVSDICLINEKGQRVELLEVGATATLEVSVSIKVDVPRLVLGFMIKDRLGQAIYGINTHRLHRSLENLSAGDSVKFRFTFPANIGKGNYSVATSLSRFDSHIDTNYEWRDFALIFHVINTRKPDFVGCTSLDAQLEIEQSSPSVVMG